MSELVCPGPLSVLLTSLPLDLPAALAQAVPLGANRIDDPYLMALSTFSKEHDWLELSKSGRPVPGMTSLSSSVGRGHAES
jgi:hypothetical protein